MADKPYIKDPNGQRGGPGKWGTNEQDIEDFEQEQLIKQWLEREGMSGSIELQHINRQGNARNTLIKASFSLDQEFRDEAGAGTFADIIAGVDGRDLESGGDESDAEEQAREQVFWYLSALGFKQGEIECLVKTLKLSITGNKSRSEKSLIDLESWTQFEPFST